MSKTDLRVPKARTLLYTKINILKQFKILLGKTLSTT